MYRRLFGPSAHSLHLGLAAALLSFLFVITASLQTGATSIVQEETVLTDQEIPVEYGEVIYRINESSPRQIYVVGISHRNPDSGRNNVTTVQTQAEIFRIGEWLNRNRGLELLLPEGYFEKKKQPVSTLPGMVAHTGPSEQPQLNNILLYEKLADESRFINAEMLLMEYFDMYATQIEDQDIYNAVRRTLDKIGNSTIGSLPARERLAELHFLQELRTAVLLQNIPTVVDQQLNHGVITNGCALFTIGLNHIQDIIRYFEADGIMIEPSRHAALNMQDKYIADLNLLKQGYGITIILPRNLADDKGLLQAVNLDGILLAERSTATNR